MNKGIYMISPSWKMLPAWYKYVFQMAPTSVSWLSGIPYG